MNPLVEENTGVLSTADDALAIATSADDISGPQLNTSLVSLDDVTRSEGQAWIHVTDQAESVRVVTQFSSDTSPTPGREWEDIVELSVTSSAQLVVSELEPGSQPVPLTPHGGTFRVRVSGAGRGAHSVSDHEGAPTERYLVQAWPEAEKPPRVIRLQSAHATAADALEPDNSVVEAGGSAAARIGADLDGASGARQLSGELGSVTTSRSIAASRRTLFKFFDINLQGWGGFSPPSGVLNEPCFDRPPIDGSQPLCGGNGMVRRIRTEETRPTYRVQRFAWLLPEAGVLLHQSSNQVPADDTVVTIEWTEGPIRDGRTETVVTVRHDGLPIEWLDDMKVWWDLQLELIAWQVENG